MQNPDVALTRAELENAPSTLLSPGRYANAVVRLCRVAGAEWVMKDFSRKPWLVRNLLGRYFMRREVLAMNRLRGLPGIPQDARRVDAYATAYRHMPGRVLHKCAEADFTPDFFPALERLVQEMHQRGIAHLDLRYRHNVLVLSHGGPGIIDFQSAVVLDRLPGWLKRHLMNVDLSGVYKHWRKRSPGTLGEDRQRLLDRENRLRRLWIFRGYIGQGKKPKPAG